MASSGQPLPSWRDLVRELPVVVFAVAAYFGVRGLTEGSYAEALSNAQRVVSFERDLGIFREIELQDLIIRHQWLVTLMNWVYIWGHWPVIAVSAGWLFFRHPSTYFLVRNAFLISGAIGLVVFVTFPVAPPRLAQLGVSDTVTLHSHAYRVLQPPAFVNQYAAMPSLHLGWNMLIGGAVAFCTRVRAIRFASAALPVAMAMAIVLTANHFILDAFAGVALSLAALAASAWIRARASTTTAGHRLLRRWTGLPEVQ